MLMYYNLLNIKCSLLSFPIWNYHDVKKNPPSLGEMHYLQSQLSRKYESSKDIETSILGKDFGNISFYMNYIRF